MWRTGFFSNLVLAVLLFLFLIVELSAIEIPSSISSNFTSKSRPYETQSHLKIGLKDPRIPLKRISLFPFSQPLPQSFMTTPELILTAGYSVESHTIVTADKYFLTIFRIPRGRGANPNLNGTERKGEPILLQTGLFCSSVDWLLLPKTEALPFLLADQGYDVWLGNFRGASSNRDAYNRQHETLTPDDLEFWDFSFYEMGVYDTTATVSYILSVTKYEQMLYVGHSMAFAALTVAINHDLTLNQKIRKAVQLAPATYIIHFRTPVYQLISLPPSELYLAVKNFFANGRGMPAKLNEFLRRLGPYFCSNEIPLELVCKNIIFLFAGFDRPGLTDELAISASGHFAPADISAKTLVHYFQCREKEVFQNYDYGPEQNLLRYGSVAPPLYSLNLVRIPTFVLYGKNDWIVVPQDAERTIRELGNVEQSLEMPDPLFNHMDFLYHKTANVQVYSRILSFIQK